MNDQAMPATDTQTTDLQQQFGDLIASVNQHVVGQPLIAQQVVEAMLADGHVILEGPPGVAKTRMARLLFQSLEGSFNRIQFTPDLLPSDLIGGAILDHSTQQFAFQRGPLFANYILADEINRAPAKVQSALLEAMEERQISSGETSYALPPTFFVIATQNPIEHDGTWDLPQAQLDRFMLQINIDYADAQGEKDILDLLLDEAQQHQSADDKVEQSIGINELLQAQRQVREVHVSAPVRDYIVRLLTTLRTEPSPLQGVTEHLAHPASSRGSITLAAVAKARAWLDSRDYVVPEDVRDLAVATLAHRVALTYRAEADGIRKESLIERLVEHVDLV